MSTSAPVKAVWVHPKTYEMLVQYGLLQADKPLPYLRDGRFVAVHALMPSTGFYDEPTPQLAAALAAAVRSDST